MIGIIGGGQLALMLADAASRLGLEVLILASTEQDPVVKKYPEKSIIGKVKAPEILGSFFSKVKTVIFENEFVDCDYLAEVAKTYEVKYVPELHTLRLFQDKLKQKKLLVELGIPTADFLELGAAEKVSNESLENALKKLGGSCVLKWSRMGYDGKGVFVLDSSEAIVAGACQKFLKEASLKKSEIYAEKKIPFKRELAIIGIYSVSREFRSYPLVISEQKEGICYAVYGPTQVFDVPQDLTILAPKLAEKVATSQNLFGAFALEFFETAEGELLVNEIAPRVHNSGHYSQDVQGAVDQFESHLRAVTGLPLASTAPTGGYTMVNLIGPAGLVLQGVSGLPRVQMPVELKWHWYGKAEVRPGRKMGHINAHCSNAQDLPTLVSSLKAAAQKWKNDLEQSTRVSRNS